jgi:hypothetical protein
MMYPGRYTMTPMIVGNRFSEALAPDLLLALVCLICLLVF